MEGMIIVIIIALLPLVVGPLVVLYFIVKSLINYSAKKHAEAIHYDELAKKIASEIMRTQLYMEKQKKATSQGQKTNNTAQNAAPQPQQYRPPTT